MELAVEPRLEDIEYLPLEPGLETVSAYHTGQHLLPKRTLGMDTRFSIAWGNWKMNFLLKVAAKEKP